MPAAAFNGVMTTGHGKYKPTQVIASQSKLFFGGLPAIVNGDLANYHGHTPVGQVIAASKLFVGGRAVAKIGDSLTDSDVIAQGSPKVFIN